MTHEEKALSYFKENFIAHSLFLPHMPTSSD